MFVNYRDGRGRYGDQDIAHISVTGRNPQPFWNYVCRLKITQTVGTAINVDRIIVCRKPVLVVGDSFSGGTSGGEAVLAHVGAKVGSAFTEHRYVIIAGIPGCTVLPLSSTNTRSSNIGTFTSILARWDSPEQDLCVYRDVIVTFLNGPGLNDISGTNCDSEAKKRFLTAKLSGAIAKMVGDALAAGNDVIMCEMVPYLNDTYSNDYNKELQRVLNGLLCQIAYSSNVPLASVYDEIPLSYIRPDGTHPTENGDAFIANKVARAYESN